MTGNDACAWDTPEALTVKGFSEPVTVPALRVGDAEPSWPIRTELDTQGTASLVGRQHELDELMAFWSAPAGDRPLPAGRRE
jgi:hypothetical protein